MKKLKAAQQLNYLISDNCKVYDGEVYLSRAGALKILDGLIELGMYPPLNELGTELACTSDHDNRDIGYVTKTFLKWDK